MGGQRRKRRQAGYLPPNTITRTILRRHSGSFGGHKDAHMETTACPRAHRTFSSSSRRTHPPQDAPGRSQMGRTTPRQCTSTTLLLAPPPADHRCRSSHERSLQTVRDSRRALAAGPSKCMPRLSRGCSNEQNRADSPQQTSLSNSRLASQAGCHATASGRSRSPWVSGSGE